ncbi:MAG: molybdopterin molybdotransferase MoeA [Gammaproteobacteria bacterium]|nr:molybdopterin molybdotransferase MoeA [Gammaproteobacteria bacterium]
MSEDCCSSPSLISVDDAITRILEPVSAVEQLEVVDIENALGRVLAEDVCSSINVPGYDNSAMDGYAVRSADCVEPGSQLLVAQRIPAGQVGSPLEAGTAARIFTGAPIPPNADAVVMQEHCDIEDDQVSINKPVKMAQHIRRAGEDISQGSVVLKAGHQLRPQELGLLASVGLAKVSVTRKLKVATFFTGDEIIEPGKKLGEGQIYNSNKYTIKGLLQTTGCEILDLGIVPDTLEATLKVLKQASSETDLVVTSGGVSVGEEDYVRIALEQLGELKMWRIAMKPGKPVAYGKVGDAIFMGLPGNPVSTFVTFLLFVKPLILKLQGAEKYLPVKMTVIADFEWPSLKRQEYLRVRLIESDKGLLATLYPHQGSGVLSSACWADGLVEASIDQAIKKGDKVNYLYFS